MHVESLAYRTDLIFPRFDGVVVDRGGYIVAHTPKNPTFYWGSFLLFANAPRDGDFERWRRLFEREFGHDSAVRHQAFGWDAVDGERGHLDPFLADGFEVVDDAVLTIDRPGAAPVPPGLTVRPLEGDADWQAMVALNIAGDPLEAESAEYAEFKRRLRIRYRAMVEGGLGVWLGAFADGRLVGQLGLFAAGELARFQSVETHPDCRGRGVCAALVAHASRVGLGELGAERLVVAATQDSTAHRIYRRVGFSDTQRQVGVFRALG